MQQSNNKIFYTVFSILIVFVCYFVNYYYFIPGYKVTRNDLSSIDAQAQAAADKKESLEKSKQTLASMGPLLDQVLVAIPSTKDTPNIIAELEAIVKKNNCVVPSIQVKDSSDTVSSESALSEDKKNEVNISLTVNGDFNNLNTLVTDIENDLKFFEVKGFGFNSSQSSTSMSLQLLSYKQSTSYSLIYPDASVLPEIQN